MINIIFKYKLHHIPLWFAYHFLWWTMRIGSPVDVFYAIFYSPGTAKFFFYMVFQAIAVYFNLYYLVPRFLEKGKYLTYTSILVGVIIATALCIVSGYYVASWSSGLPFKDLYGVEPSNWYALFEGGALPSTVASMTLAMSIKLAGDWLRSRRREKILEKEKLETELKFLRSQFNPHFLFNTINSIFVLINKNPAVASQALAKFSDLLRYQLYECNENEIPLRQELTYIENFIELEKLRHSTHDLNVNIDISKEHQSNLLIAPLLLIPFIENAFKHVSRSPDHENFIDMKLSMDKGRLTFRVVNTARAQNEVSRELLTHDGIGLKNVRRRLDLLYHDGYSLTTGAANGQYTVLLEIQLRSEKAVASPVESAIAPALNYNRA